MLTKVHMAGHARAGAGSLGRAEVRYGNDTMLGAQSEASGVPAAPGRSRGRESGTDFAPVGVMRTTLCRLVASFGCLGLGAGCLGLPASSSPLDADEFSSPDRLTAREAAFYISRAQCQHEADCSNVGAGRTFTSTDSCVAELDRIDETDLAPSVCGDGVQPLQMRRCVKAFELETCHTMSSRQRMNACDPSILCG
jgi:hypothetical protein